MYANFDPSSMKKVIISDIMEIKEELRLIADDDYSNSSYSNIAENLSKQKHEIVNLFVELNNNNKKYIHGIGKLIKEDPNSNYGMSILINLKKAIRLGSKKALELYIRILESAHYIVSEDICDENINYRDRIRAMGVFHEYLKYLKENVDKNNDAESMFQIAFICDIQNDDKLESYVLKYYKMAADTGEPEYVRHYAYALLKRNRNNEALEYFQIAADKGNIASAYEMIKIIASNPNAEILGNNMVKLIEFYNKFKNFDINNNNILGRFGNLDETNNFASIHSYIDIFKKNINNFVKVIYNSRQYLPKRDAKIVFNFFKNRFKKNRSI